MPRTRTRRSTALRRLIGLGGFLAAVGATRRRAMAANERRYADELGLTGPGGEVRAPRPGVDGQGT